MLQRLVGAGIAAVQGSRAACCGGMLQLHQQASCSALERTQTAGCGRGAAVRLQQVHMHAAAMQHALQQRCQTAPSPDALSGMFFAPYKALLVDAAGTLLVPRERTADVYLRYGRKYNVQLSEPEVLQRYRRAYNTPWRHSPLRYVGDGRAFWKFVVQASTGCPDARFFEEVYAYYERPEAWTLAPGAAAALTRLRQAGVRTAVVSNFDLRLRPILASLGCLPLFDEVVVSAEVGAEKPNPVIFESALQRLRLRECDVVHVGDDRRNDIWGARDAGITAWLWGVDVHSFDEVARRVLRGPARALAGESDSDEDDEDEDVGGAA